MQHAPGERRVLEGFLEQDLLGFSLGHHALGGVSHTTSVMLGGDGGGENVLVAVHGFSEDVVPLAEANHHVPGHGDVGFQENRTHGDDAGEHELNTVVCVAGRKRVDSFSSVLQCRLVLTVKHGAPHDEVVVVHSVKLVELRLVSGGGDVVVVGFHGCDVAFNGFFPLTDPSVDVRRHVDQVAQARHSGSQHIGCGKRLLGERREFEGVAVQVTEGRVDLGLVAAFEGLFHDLDQQQGVVVGRCNLSRRRVFVPELPGLEVHQRLDVNGRDVQVSSVLFVQGGHGFGKRHVQFHVVAHVEHRWVGRITSLFGVAG